MTEKNVGILGDWLKKPITWVVIVIAGLLFVLQQMFAPGLLGGSDRADRTGQEMQVDRAPGVEVPHGDEVTVIYSVENRTDEAVEISSAEITYVRVEGGGPECTGASRAGVQAKLENHLVGTRIERRGVYDFDVIFTGRDRPVPDCLGATIQADVEIRVVAYQ
ncbi:hypothetical protein ABS642_10805 [Microbacterium sp. A8/3-1]|uniref:Uncharacterized protein n=1 Tax=Microbacterium sp. A8/3-1 TaxID=3160749 RepID=A0AAU7W1M9_9MICO